MAAAIPTTIAVATSTAMVAATSATTVVATSATIAAETTTTMTAASTPRRRGRPYAGPPPDPETSAQLSAGGSTTWKSEAPAARRFERDCTHR
ncbi:hypothetical protein F4811DRAFT_508436 [Daldinia bambusicola]|nr:hypothetical protein F4811DRAFT_508436 [Daldinia bambusicola]